MKMLGRGSMVAGGICSSCLVGLGVLVWQSKTAALRVAALVWDMSIVVFIRT